MNRIQVFLMVSVLAMACNDNDQGRPAKERLKEFWLDYQVWGEEDKENVTVMLQFRTEYDSNGTHLLKAPAAVELDGEPFQADSSKMTGVYYEMEKPLQAFSGTHAILFRDFNGKNYEEKFDFTIFRLSEEIPDTLHRSDIAFQFDGVEKKDYIRIIALDTLFRSNGLNEVDTVWEGKLVLSREQLKNLVNGPIKIEFYREVERPLNNGWPGGGRLSFSYGFKRNFVLQD